MAAVEAIEAALSIGDLRKAEELIGESEARRPEELMPSVRGHTARLRARIDATREEHEAVEAGFEIAAREFRGIPMPFWVAVTLLEHAEWLIGRGATGEAGPLLAEARELFEALRARPWIERVASASEQVSQQPASAAPA